MCQRSPEACRGFTAKWHSFVHDEWRVRRHGGAPSRSLLQPKQHSEPLAHIGNDVGRSPRFERESPRLPIEVLDVIGENDPRDLPARRQRYFERVALHVTGNRACNGKARFGVVAARREDQSRTPTALLMTGLRIERQPDQIAGVWYVCAGYHASSPTGVPQSLSSWRFRGVILATSRCRE